MSVKVGNRFLKYALKYAMAYVRAHRRFVHELCQKKIRQDDFRVVVRVRM